MRAIVVQVFDYSSVPRAGYKCAFRLPRPSPAFWPNSLSNRTTVAPHLCNGWANPPKYGVNKKFHPDAFFSVDYVVRNDYKVSMAIDQKDESAPQSDQMPAGRAQRRAGRTRRRLLDAALQMFSDRGVDATTIEDITEGADVGKGTFYRHFSNKDEVVLALVEDSVDQLVGLMSPAGHPPARLEEALSDILAAHATFFQQHTDEFVLLFQGRVLLKLQREIGEDLEAPYQRYLSEIEQRIAPLVVQPVDRAKIRRLSCAVAGFVSGFFSFAMIGMSPDEIEQSLAPLRTAFLAASSTFLAGV